MTNREKQEYISLLEAYSTTPMIAEIEKRNEFYRKTPKTLYKYRRFDEFTFDMLANDYVYLTPAKFLDDPFDCLTNIDLSSMSPDGVYSMNDEMAEYIANIILSYPHSEEFTKADIKKVIKESVVNGKVDIDSFNLWIKKTLGLEKDFIEPFKNLMTAFDSAFDTLRNDAGMKEGILKLADSRESFGVCAFTTKRDNQTMWSLYSDTYKGYCVEYTTPNLKSIVWNLYPVIYSKKGSNDLIKTLVNISMATAIRGYTDAKTPTSMLGSIPELLCTKDPTWRYQDEWRLIGTPKLKVDVFTARNVYLGFDVTPENERKIIECSMRKGFGVCKMNRPNGDKRITYSKIK